jgi:hypothetical protein
VGRADNLATFMSLRASAGIALLFIRKKKSKLKLHVQPIVFSWDQFINKIKSVDANNSGTYSSNMYTITLAKITKLCIFLFKCY